MKLHELAKQIGFKSTDVLNKAKELGLQIGSITSNLKQEEELILTKAFEGIEPPKPEAEKVKFDTVPENLKKGSLIGIVHDGEKYVMVSIRLTLDQVKKYEHQVFTSHRTLPGAMVEMYKKITKVISLDTVKNFK